MLKLKPLLRKNKKRLEETGKSILIVLLAVSMLFLLDRMGAFSIISDSGMLRGIIPSRGSDTAENTGYTAAASPLYMIVTPETGAHCAVMYDADALSEMYGRFSPSLAQAIGSAKEPVKVTADDWRSALAGCGVYFDFYNDQLISALAGWLGVQVTEGIGAQTARRICLAQDGDGIALYFIRARMPDEIYRCDTALKWSAVSDKIGECMPNGAQYNFELENGFSAVDPYAVIVPEQLSVPSLAVTNPLSSVSEYDPVLSAFGMNGYLITPYTDPEGTEVYVEGDATLRIGTNGTVLYNGSNGQEESGLPPAAVIETARKLCAETLGRYCGEAALRLSYVYSPAGSDTYTIRFDYAMNGLPVVFSDGNSAAEMTIIHGAVTSARLVFRQYSYAGKTEKPLPPLMAAAVVQASGGGEPVLSYMDDMSGAAACWTIN